METVDNKDIRVSVIIPVYNEEEYIVKCIESVLKQNYPKSNMEVIFIDGNSSDKTVEIINSYIGRYNHIRILNNPNRTVQYALNIGIKNAKGEYIVRMDAHAEYAPDYVSKSVEFLERTNADNVGGPTIAKGRNFTQKVIAAAYHSPFALGGGKCHYEDYEGYADTVSFGAYRKSKAIEIGLYDEKFPRNEDDEFNYRLIKSGGKIYITPQIKSIYYPRDNIKDLFKQYFGYGLWKPAVIKKHKKPARLSHLVPMCFIIFLLPGLFIALCSEPGLKVYLTVIGFYLVLDAIFSFRSKHTDNFPGRILLMYIHFIIHISYGLGFTVGFISLLLKTNSEEHSLSGCEAPFK